MGGGIFITWHILTLCLLIKCQEYTCPEGCNCILLETIICRQNEFNDLPEEIYDGVLHLDLSFNNFERIPQSMSQFKNLKELHMANNKISKLSKESLEGLDALEVLDLSNNYFTDWRDINLNVFIPTESLIELDLSYNALKGFHDLLEPPKINSLRVLKLVNCSINDVYGDTLNAFPNIEELYMAKNEITNIKTQIKSKTLKLLDLRNCGLKHINPDGLSLLPQLKTIQLSNNYELKKFDCNSNSLEYIDISECNIQKIPTAKLPMLRKANYSGNHIRNLLKNNFYNSTKIQVLDLSNNAFSTVDINAFKGLKSLHTLYLSYNTISFIDPLTFADNTKLEKLDLSHNYFHEVIQFNISSLKYLDLSVCEIRIFNRYSLIDMQKLEELILSGNLITRLPDNIESYSLYYLNLAYCDITKINNQTFENMPNLRKLNLAGNRLTSNIKVSYFPQILEIQLDDNPWHCDCSFDFLEIYEQLMLLQPQPRCQSPESVEGEIWTEACAIEWYASKTKADSMWWYSFGLVIILVVTFCIICSIRRAYQQKEERLQQAQEQERSEARERLRRMRQQQLEAREMENRNAPDPRELQRPPSYTEALLMSSVNSLTGSRHSLAGNRQNERTNNSETTGRNKTRRKRRTEKSASSDENRSATRRTRKRSKQNEHTERTSSDSEPTHRVTLESDF